MESRPATATSGRRRVVERVPPRDLLRRAATVAAQDLLFPNGSVITPDGRTLIVGETAGSHYTALTIRCDGSLDERRVWGQVATAPELTTFAGTLAALRFGPDGCTLDAEGHIWSADEVGARCVRLAPGGAIVDEIAAPGGLDCFACMLAGLLFRSGRRRRPMRGEGSATGGELTFCAGCRPLGLTTFGCVARRRSGMSGVTS